MRTTWMDRSLRRHWSMLWRTMVGRRRRSMVMMSWTRKGRTVVRGAMVMMSRTRWRRMIWVGLQEDHLKLRI